MTSLPRGLVARFARLRSSSSAEIAPVEVGETPLCMKEETKVLDEKKELTHSEEDLERVIGSQGLLREKLERLTDFKRATKHGAFEAPHIRAYNIISFVEDNQGRDPLVHPSKAHNPFVILKPQDASNHISKTIDKEIISSRSRLERSKVLCLSPWSSDERLVDGVFQLWRLLLDTQPAKEIRRYVAEEYSRLAMDEMRAIANAFFKLELVLDSHKNLLTATQLVNPTPNLAIDQQDLVLLWKESKFKAAFHELHRNRTERISYVLDAMGRINAPDYTPLINDKMVLYNLSDAVFDHCCSSSERKMQFVSISRMKLSHPPRMFKMFSSAEMVLFFVSLANDFSTLSSSLDDFTEVLNCDYYRKIPVIVVFTDMQRFKEMISKGTFSDHFPDYTGGCNGDQALQFVANLFGRTKSAHSAKLFTHFAEQLTKKSVTFFGKTLRDCSMDATAVEGAMKPLVGL